MSRLRHGILRGVLVAGVSLSGGASFLTGADVLAAAARGQPRQPLTVTAGAVSGEVQMKTGTGEWKALLTGDTLPNDARVRTDALSTVRLDQNRGAPLLLGEQTTVQLRPLEPADLAIVLEAGELHSTFPAKNKALPLRLWAPDGSRADLVQNAQVPTTYRLTAVQGGLAVAVLEGELSLIGRGIDVKVPAGRHVSLARGEAGAVEPLLVAPTPLGPTLMERFFCPGLVLRLEWSSVAGAAAYRVEVSRDASFVPPVWSREGASTRTLFVAPSPARYLVRITAKDAQGRPGVPSAAQPLFCEATPPEDLLVQPEPDGVVKHVKLPLTAELRWKPREGARSYRVAVSSTPDLLGAQARVVTVREPWAKISGLKEGTYHWGVWVADDSQPLFLEPRRFTVKRADKVKVPSKLEWGQ